MNDIILHKVDYLVWIFSLRRESVLVLFQTPHLTSRQASHTEGETQFWQQLQSFRLFPICHFDGRRLEHNSAATTTTTVGQCCFTVTAMSVRTQYCTLLRSANIFFFFSFFLMPSLLITERSSDNRKC